MNAVFWILVIYVAVDLLLSAYVIYRRGGLRATASQIKRNLRQWKADKEDSHVLDPWDARAIQDAERRNGHR